MIAGAEAETTKDDSYLVLTGELRGVFNFNKIDHVITAPHFMCYMP